MRVVYWCGGVCVWCGHVCECVSVCVCACVCVWSQARSKEGGGGGGQHCEPSPCRTPPPLAPRRRCAACPPAPAASRWLLASSPGSPPAPCRGRSGPGWPAAPPAQPPAAPGGRQGRRGQVGGRQGEWGGWVGRAGARARLACSTSSMYSEKYRRDSTNKIEAMGLGGWGQRRRDKGRQPCSPSLQPPAIRNQPWRQPPLTVSSSASTPCPFLALMATIGVLPPHSSARGRQAGAGRHHEPMPGCGLGCCVCQAGCRRTPLRPSHTHAMPHPPPPTTHTHPHTPRHPTERLPASHLAPGSAQ